MRQLAMEGVVVTGVFWAISASAQPPNNKAAPAPVAPQDPEEHIVEELVVVAALPGPAWWKIERDGAVVYIMGLPDEPLATGQQLDRPVFQRRLASAKVLIEPVAASAGLFDVSALLSLRGKLESSTPTEEGLPDVLRSRFAAAQTNLGRTAKRYAGWTPIYAGQKLVDDFHAAAQTHADEPIASIRAEARHQKVSIRAAGHYRAVGVLNAAIGNLTTDVSQYCLSEALNEVEAGADALKTAGTAWAQGDVAGVLAGPRGFASCRLLLSGGTEFWGRTIEQETSAVAAALEQPGHSVAVFPLRSLLATDGILSRLRKQGFSVSGRQEQ